MKSGLQGADVEDACMGGDIRCFGSAFIFLQSSSLD